MAKTGTGRPDSWLLGLEPEGLIRVADGCWETEPFCLTLAFPPLASAEMWSAGQGGRAVPAQ